MNEQLLQFIWRYRYYNSTQLFTTAGEPIIVRIPGTLNHNQGPDFLGAQIQIHQTSWVGNIELHIYSSDFIKHQHQKDKRYQQIILHVVWEDDIPLIDAYGNQVPTLALANLVPKMLLNRYRSLMKSTQILPCAELAENINELIWNNWKERLVAERLMGRALQLKSVLEQLRGNWEQLIWQMIARYMGGKVNGDLFAAIFQTVPYSVWKKYSYDLTSLEALLMGQAGLLTKDFKDDYPKQLKSEYNYLLYKYQLSPPKQSAAFLRMRPASFPTIRLSQLAILMQRNPSLLDFFKQNQPIKALRKLFSLSASEYWNEYYLFEEPSNTFSKKTGRHLQNSLIINVVVMVLYLYGDVQNNNKYKDQAVELLAALPAEQNRILKIWFENGITNQSALHSQALLELTQHYCTPRACLNCTIGNVILKRGVLFTS
jgi:hypothetical protein